METKAFQANIWKYYLWRTLVGFRLVAPIRVLFFLTFISYAEIGIVELVASIVILVLEVPSGIFADLVGRKVSMVIATALSAAAFLLVGLGSGLGLFALGWALSGAADAFQSGADEALLYDSLARLDREDEYLKIISRLNGVNAATVVIGSLFGAYLFEINIRLPWLIFAGLIGASAVVIATMREPQGAQATYTMTNQLDHLKEAVRFAGSHRTVRWLIGFALLLSIPGFAFGTLISQPYLVSRGYEVTTLGLIFAVIHGISGGISALSDQIERKLGERTSFLLISGLYVAIFVLAGFIRAQWPVLALVVLLYVVRNYKNVLINSYIHGHIPSARRATVISLQSFLNNSLVMLLIVLIGYLIDRFGLDAVLVGLGVTVGLGALPLLATRYLWGTPGTERVEADTSEETPVS
jgi:MFS family permease